MGKAQETGNAWQSPARSQPGTAASPLANISETIPIIERNASAPDNGWLANLPCQRPLRDRKIVQIFNLRPNNVPTIW